MTCRKLLQSTLGTILVIWFAVGCSTPTATQIPPTATLTPKSPTFTPTSTPTVAPGGFPRRFHVEGNTFVDQYGQTMVFRGMASPDPVQQAVHNNLKLSAWNEQYYQVMAEWGANVIRLPIVPYSLHQFGWAQTLHVLDQTIEWAGKNKMYVIIDFHSIGWLPDNWYPPGVGSETTIQEFQNFWDAISRRYANNDVVAFYELFNEPARSGDADFGSPADWKVWKGIVEQVIAIIRANDPHKSILVSGLQASYNPSFAAAAPIADDNVGYVTHPYPSQYIYLNWDTAFGNLSSKYPVFATEFGYDQRGNPDIDINGIPYHQAIIDYLEAHHMSWMVWCFDADWETTLLTDNQTYKPSPSGEYFRSRLLELNQHP